MRFELLTEKVNIIHSIILAIQGARLAKKSLGRSDFFVLPMTRGFGEKDYELAVQLSNTSVASGHDKFLQQIPFSVDVTISRAVWQEFDTYRVGISKQSESTMHTLTKDNLSEDDFELDAYDEKIHPEVRENIARYLIFVKDVQKKRGEKYYTETQARELLKACLPENFLQKRRVHMSYGTLKTMNQQRKKHRVQEWIHFLGAMEEVLPYPELWLNIK